MTPATGVSCIVIFLNEERFLAEAIDSVLAQTHESWELLLVDDGSTDGSAAIAREFAERHPDRVRYLRHPGRANLGMSAARNLGLAHARGRYVGFLDADDAWLPGQAAEQVEILDSRPGRRHGLRSHTDSGTAGAGARAERSMISATSA